MPCGNGLLFRGIVVCILESMQALAIARCVRNLTECWSVARVPPLFCAHTMTTIAFRGLFRNVVFALLGTGLAACAAVPVQEMSDARQAVQAALEAGAEQRAPQQMNAAQTALQTAETQLKRSEYRRAKRSALEARTKAIEAREVAQEPVAN